MATASSRRPRSFGAMREDRVLAMAQQRFGKSYTSRASAIFDLSRLPVAEQHALAKPSSPMGNRHTLASRYRAMTGKAVGPNATRDQLAREILRTRAAVVGPTPATVPAVARSARSASLVSRGLRVAGALARSGSVQGLAMGAGVGLASVAARSLMQSSTGRELQQRNKALSRAVDAGATALAVGTYASWGISVAANAKGVRDVAGAVVRHGRRVAEAAAASQTATDAATAGSTAVSAASQAKKAQVLGGKLAKGTGKVAARVAKLADSKAALVAGRLIDGRVVTALSRVALPLLAARTIYSGVTGYQRDGLKGAAVGVADVFTAGRTSAALDGYAKGGIVGALDSAAYGLGSRLGIVPKSQKELASSAKAGSPRAYLSTAAQARAQAGHMPPQVAPAATAAAAKPSDGVTAGYQRVDKRSGKTVSVKEYRTPTA